MRANAYNAPPAQATHQIPQKTPSDRPAIAEENSSKFGQYYDRQVNHMAKDYSKDPNVNGWGETDAHGNVVEMGPVALQA